MKYDVFISYSTCNQKTVEAICAYLEQHKIRCFVAYRDIPKGVVWARAIVEALEESRMMLVVFSEEFNMSDQVDREIELASSEGMAILTFRISDSDFKGAKKYYLKNLNWIDAYPHPEKSFGNLLENVAKLLDMKIAPVVTTLQSSDVEVVVEKEVSAKNYQVGDYYHENGIEGIVFEVSDGGRHGKVVSLDKTGDQWCTEAQYEKKIVVGASSETDGKYNTDKIAAQGLSNYPAAKWCRGKGSQWYLPAREELRAIYRNRRKIDNSLLQNGGIGIANFHWSSTEDEFCAWGVYLHDGNAGRSRKYGNTYVRAVFAF